MRDKNIFKPCRISFLVILSLCLLVLSSLMVFADLRYYQDDSGLMAYDSETGRIFMYEEGAWQVHNDLSGDFDYMETGDDVPDSVTVFPEDTVPQGGVGAVPEEVIHPPPPEEEADEAPAGETEEEAQPEELPPVEVPTGGRQIPDTRNSIITRGSGGNAYEVFDAGGNSLGTVRRDHEGGFRITGADGVERPITEEGLEDVGIAPASITYLQQHTLMSAPSATHTEFNADFREGFTPPSGINYFCFGSGCGVEDTGSGSDASRQQTYYALGPDGIVYHVNEFGQMTTEAEGMTLQDLNQMHTEELSGGEEEGEVTPVVTWGSGDAPDRPPNRAFGEITWNSLAAAARRSGGWFNFFLGEESTQRFARSISRWAGYDEDNPACPHCVAWIHNAFSYEAWADMACRRNYLTGDKGTTFLSRSGYTSLDIEGEKKQVFPCGKDVVSETFQLPNGSAVDCRPYYEYKISGYANPAEVQMEFDVYLNRKDSDRGFEAGEDLHLYYDSVEDEYIKIKLNRSGAPWSLSGANMLVYRAYEEYDKACIKFTKDSFRLIQTVIPINADELDDMNPYCNNIKDAFVSQTVGEDEDGGGSGRGLPGGTSPGTGGEVGPGGGNIGPG